MKKFIGGFLLGTILVVLTFLMGFDFKRSGLINLFKTHKDIHDQIMPISQNKGEDILAENLVLEGVNSLLRQEKKISGDMISSRLKKRFLDGEFDILKQNGIKLVELKIFQKLFISDKLDAYVVDVTFQRDNGFQWIQLTALWNPKEKKLYDLIYRPIDYLARLNSQVNSKEGMETVRQILQNLNSPDQKLMGWRYKKVDNPGQQGIKVVQVLNIDYMGSYIPPRGDMPLETAYKARYTVKGYDQEKEIESILYLKNYAGHWQLEDITILDVKEMENSP